MASYLTLPRDFGDVISNFAECYLINRPDDIIEYAADYFERLQLNRRRLMIYGSMDSNTSFISPATDVSSSSSSSNTIGSSTLSSFENLEKTEDEVLVPKSTRTDRGEYTYLLNLLKDIPRFAIIDEIILKDIIDMMYSITLSAGDTVFDEDDPRNNLYIIEQGIFNVIMINHETCQEEILYVYANQGNFGQRFVRQNCPIPVTVRAITDGVLWVIEGRVIYKIIVALNKSTKINY